MLVVDASVAAKWFLQEADSEEALACVDRVGAAIQAAGKRATRQLAAPFKLAITGTPMENSLMELWSLLSITAPGLFPSPTKFKDYYARAIEKGRDAGLLGQLPLGVSGSPVAWIAASFISSFLFPWIQAANQAIWQSEVPAAVQGRVFAARRVMTESAGPIVLLVAVAGIALTLPRTTSAARGPAPPLRRGSAGLARPLRSNARVRVIRPGCRR